MSQESRVPAPENPRLPHRMADIIEDAERWWHPDDELAFKAHTGGALRAAAFCTFPSDGDRVREPKAIVLVDLMQAVFILLRVYRIDAPNHPTMCTQSLMHWLSNSTSAST